MKHPGTVLVVEDDDAMRQLLEEEIQGAGHDVIAAAGGDEALEALQAHSVDVVVTDHVMPGMKGSELLAEIRQREPDIPVVMITAFGSIESAVEAMRSGAFHYAAKPFRIERLLETLESALHQRRTGQEFRRYRENHEGEVSGLVAESAAMRKLLELVARGAAADTPLLLMGESGTGKELVARMLHTLSPRGNKRFMAVNCSAIPETLLESQLFGYRRGAFTDARDDHRGLFQETAGGTILLDEIGDLPLSLQGKLLRVLQEREVHPVGAPAPVAIDVRVVAATHRDLDSMVEHGGFREDLLYRLNVITIRIPPLRERPEDLVPLVAHLLQKHGKRLGRDGCSVDPEVLEIFRRHPWPGNVRQLENVIERALVLGRGGRIRREDLPEALRGRQVLPKTSENVRTLDDLEREHILKTLRAVRGNKAAAARLLGLDRKTLYRKLAQYGARPG